MGVELDFHWRRRDLQIRNLELEVHVRAQDFQNEKYRGIGNKICKYTHVFPGFGN